MNDSLAQHDNLNAGDNCRVTMYTGEQLTGVFRGLITFTHAKATNQHFCLESKERDLQHIPLRDIARWESLGGKP